MKQQIFNFLDEHGYITDTQVAKLCGKEPNWTTIEEYKRQWTRLKRDREYFADKEIVETKGYKRRYLVRLKGEDHYYKVCKDFFLELSTV